MWVKVQINIHHYYFYPKSTTNKKLDWQTKQERKGKNNTVWQGSLLNIPEHILHLQTYTEAYLKGKLCKQNDRVKTAAQFTSNPTCWVVGHTYYSIMPHPPGCGKHCIPDIQSWSHDLISLLSPDTGKSDISHTQGASLSWSQKVITPLSQAGGHLPVVNLTQVRLTNEIFFMKLKWRANYAKMTQDKWTNVTFIIYIYIYLCKPFVTSKMGHWHQCKNV